MSESNPKGSILCPVKVLIVEGQSKLMAQSLSTLAQARRVTPLAVIDRDVRASVAYHAPAVILLGPGLDHRELLSLQNEPEKLSFPPVLLCIAHQGLETEDIYEQVDDFMVVPSSVSELEKRLRRLALRRPVTEPAAMLQVGQIALNLTTYEVTIEGRKVHLTWMEFQLLKFMMENPGKVFTREQLLARVWDSNTFGGTRTVDVHIRRLRSKLSLSSQDYFRTVKNVGYGIVYP